MIFHIGARHQGSERHWNGECLIVVIKNTAQQLKLTILASAEIPPPNKMEWRHRIHTGIAEMTEKGNNEVKRGGEE